MPLSSYLTRLLRWLRTGYPQGAPPHRHIPLIALMPSPAAQLEDLLHTGELPPRFTTHPRQAMHRRNEPNQDRDLSRPRS